MAEILDYLKTGIEGFLDYERINAGLEQPRVINTAQRPYNPDAQIQPLQVAPSNDQPQSPASPLDLSGNVSMMGMSLPLWVVGLTVVGGVYLLAKRGG